MRHGKWAALLSAAASLLLAACAGEAERPYLERRAAFKTRLVKFGPAKSLESPEMFPETWTLPDHRVHETRYRSGDFDLKAWVYSPDTAPASRAPGLVFLHGGWGASRRTIRDCKPFLDAGFAVMVPSFRGEAGNPGNFEFWMGDTDDAAAATRWFARQPHLDPDRIFVFGWSYGGGLSALLSLMDDVPIRHSASSGGLFDQRLLELLAGDGMLPFDVTDTQETRLRMLVGNIRWMRRKHYAYIGLADFDFRPAITAVKQETKGRESLIEIIMVPGEHISAGRPAMLRYFDLVGQELAASP